MNAFVVLLVFAVAMVQAAFVVVIVTDASWAGWLGASLLAGWGMALVETHGYSYGYAHGMNDELEIEDLVKGKNGNG